jgi:hypothetical protein
MDASRHNRRSLFRSWDSWTQYAAVLWASLLAVVCVRGVLQPTSHSLYPTYARAGAEWLSRGIVYHEHWQAPYDQYRYSPLVSAFLSPFSLLPLWLGSELWRLLNAAVFLGAFGWWLRDATPAVVDLRRKAILFILVCPLALGSLNNGQPNLLVIGLLLAALAAAAGRRWMLSALCVGLSCALKVYPIALGLLLAVVYPRRFAPRLLAALIVLAVLPFALQQPEYVADQYLHWLKRLGHNDRMSWPLEASYRDLWLLIRVARLPLDPTMYLGIQLVSAAGCAALCVAAPLRRAPKEKVLLHVLALGTCWMILCGPATESCTFVILSPALAWAVLYAPPSVPRLLARLALGLLLAGVLAGALPRTTRLHGLGMQPLGALLLSAAYVLWFVRGSVPLAAAQTLTQRWQARVREFNGNNSEADRALQEISR